MLPTPKVLVAALNADIARLQYEDTKRENERLERARRLAAEQDAKLDEALGQGRN
jgi:hypothetical protein